ncbi:MULTISPECIES: outer membrane protein [unclassified Mesorhizobium]|uniref:outer membrane protein n=1 Tax=unclassified Mesorhizobium TaxID=325217 RepID=UPI000F75CD83|nr:MULTISPECIES: outer membrane protein [unclassified Mesorhizobium]AZO65716.1 porin family protein [Mesorhizobium sp. M6A.T.Cr.TU.016.01.1.1]RUU33097.1 P44/Msp2 family outer membrane protein [Mesorhizobium sp. M6A.T.Ce.TU.002.03.1.1]RWP46146.1 MAG: P44/Msp2 family outer membrane protein [Mesorhizobium sp.]RWQ68156.1 MAG: P44/Msp2 family outer membrane protein [Mesorhizobium sp.]
MFNTARMALFAALLAGVAGPVFAADFVEPPVIEPAPPPAVYEQPAEYGGWYIRGDIDYHWSKFRGADYITYGDTPGTGRFDSGKLESAFSAGAGVGYQINQHFRTDLTADWMSKSDFRGSTSGFCGINPCTSTDTSSYTALLLLANAYVDIGTWHGITPYVGAGIGGAWVKWDKLHNTIDDDTFEHSGGKGWRFAYAAMAGASYCLTDRVKLDLGYRFSHIEGGKMFDFASDVGPGHDKGINVHEVRGGLRYQFGNSGCAQPEPIAYEPEPVYTK